MEIFSRRSSATVSQQMWRKENEEKCRKLELFLIFVEIPGFFARADLIFQKSAKKRAEAAEMMEKELADTEARQEKVDHKLKERIGNKQ